MKDLVERLARFARHHPATLRGLSIGSLLSLPFSFGGSGVTLLATLLCSTAGAAIGWSIDRRRIAGSRPAQAG